MRHKSDHEPNFVRADLAADDVSGLWLTLVYVQSLGLALWTNKVELSPELARGYDLNVRWHQVAH